MELLDRYLLAVQKYLPKRQQQDIIKELSENLLSQIEDKEAELGRPLNEDELASLLKSHGHPVVVAVRYLPHQHLIGPAIFPFFWFTLKIALLFAAAMFVLVNAILLVLGTPTIQGAIQVLLEIPKVLWITAAWVTIAFVAVEIAITRYNVKINCFEDWDPRSLPQLEQRQQKKCHHPIQEFLGSLFFIAWMLVVPSHPFLIVGPGAYYLKSLSIQLAPIWHELYWVFMALLFANLVVKGAYLFPFSWKWPRAGIDLILRLGGLVLLGMFIQAPSFFVPGPTAPENIAHLQEMIRSLNYGLLISLRIAMVIASLHLIWDGGKLLFESFRGNTKYLAMKM